ncbi:MAG: hypothetical protein ACI8UO_005010 [Verrucomicrobiales bacterium]|jgi:hypothetical protein
MEFRLIQLLSKQLDANRLSTMKMNTLIPLLFLALPLTTFADDEVVERAEDHVLALLNADLETLEAGYAEEILLLRGHELLKTEYGLAGENGRFESKKVSRAALMAAGKTASSKHERPPAEKIAELLEVLKFEVMKVKDGRIVTEAPDPVEPDNLLYFDPVLKGDVVMKIGPPGKDALFFQFRKIEEKWLIIAEYVD